MADTTTNPKKDGFQSALDVTKFNVGIAGAAIAFLLGTDSLKYAVTTLQRFFITLSLAGFGLSAICGVLVLLEGARMISEQQYGLSNYVRVPGLLNFVSLIAAFFFASLYIFVVIWWQTDP